MTARLTLGPVLFNWGSEALRDFYFRIADEAPVDTVYLGEVVCFKRRHFLDACAAEVLDRLARAGKQVVLSSLALVADEREAAAMDALAAEAGMLVEANDLGMIRALEGRPHVIGPFVNVYNEDALAFGRMPLAISARCFHARAHGLQKDSCRFVCGADPDGLDVQTLDDEPFLAVNGTQTLSHTCLNLVGEARMLADLGVARFRLSPQRADMAAVAEAFRALLDGRIEAGEATARLAEQVPDLPFSNGFIHAEPGYRSLA